MRKFSEISDDEFREVVKESSSCSQIVIKLGFTPSGHTCNNVRARLNLLGLIMS